MTYIHGDADTTVIGLLTKLKMLKTVTDNIANATTNGYKRRIPETLSFSEVFDEVALKDPTQGALTKTGNTLDIAIEGNAYFMVDTKEGLNYTRNGRLSFNDKGDLVTQEGDKVVVIEKTDKDINLTDKTEIAIDESGNIFAGTTKYGRIAMKVLDTKPVKVHQQHLEGSNVNILNEVVSLSLLHRSIEASEKILGMETSVDKDLVEKYGRNV